MLAGVALLLLAQADISGPMPKEAIAKVIAEHRSELTPCAPAGRVVVKFRIGPEGKVQSASGDECVASRVKTWSFPKPLGGGVVDVSYPFELASPPDGGGVAPTTVAGGLSKDVIMKVITRHQGEVKGCYDLALQKSPALKGKVAVQFSIGPDGAVQTAELAESTLPQALNDCVLGRVRTWKFPEPQGGGVVTITFPWVFEPA